VGSVRQTARGRKLAVNEQNDEFHQNRTRAEYQYLPRNRVARVDELRQYSGEEEQGLGFAPCRKKPSRRIPPAAGRPELVSGSAIIDDLLKKLCTPR